MDLDILHSAPDNFHFEAEPGHFRKNFEQLNQLRCQRKFCDVILRVENSQFAAHKAVLAAASNYFWAMFTGFSEASSDQVTLREVRPHAVSSLLDFMYTGEMTITSSTVQDVLEAAGMLQLTDVKMACCRFLSEQLHASNCLGINLFADQHLCEELRLTSGEFIERNFVMVSNEEEFKRLTCDRLCSLLSSDRLVVSCESEVYEAALSWVRHDTDMRRGCLAMLLDHVRLPLLRPEYLIDVVETEPLIRACPAAMDRVNRAKTTQLLPERSEPGVPRRSTLGWVYYAGGMDSSGSLCTVEKLDMATMSVSSAPSMNIHRSGVGVAVLDGRVYAVGGHDGAAYLNSVESFDPSSASGGWNLVASMHSARRYVAVIAHRNKLYVAGGYSGITVLNSAECYDPALNSWCFIASMNCRRRHVSLADLGGKLYAVGGHDGLAYLKSVECFDSASDTWTLVASMGTRRGGAGVAAVSGKLYAIGGYDGNSNHSTMERYHPTEDRWSYVAPMSVCRSGLGVAVVNDCIYAVGGHDGLHYLNIIESFDPRRGEWAVKGSMLTSRAVAGVGVLKTI